MSGVDRVRVLGEEVLSQGWAVLKKYTISYRRRDGRQETQSREIYDHGHGAALLPYDPGRGTVLLVRQFRLAAWLTGHREMLVEVCAGLLDGQDPETSVRREAQEELGYRVGALRLAFSPYASAGSLRSEERRVGKECRSRWA